MARGINKFIGIGNLGQDPEMRYMPSGSAVTNFTVAISESWVDKQTGEQRERTEWVSCEAWGKLAEVCAQYLIKGAKVYIEGKLQTDSWDDKTTGEKKYRTKVRLDNVQFLSPKGEGALLAPQTKAPPTTPKADDFDDDIPF